jgi:hypothetical protein
MSLLAKNQVLIADCGGDVFCEFRATRPVTIVFRKQLSLESLDPVSVPYYTTITTTGNSS